MSSVTISIAINLKRRPDGSSQEFVETHWREVSQVIHRQVERLLSRLNQGALYIKNFKKQQKPKRWTHDMLCECPHKCRSSSRQYWKFLRSELIWKNNHLV